MKTSTGAEPAPGAGFSSELTPAKRGAEHRRAIRSGWIVFGAGAVSTGALYLIIRSLQARGHSAAALAMPDMHMQNLHKFWSFPLLQASGLTALLFAYLSMILGLQQPARAVRGFPLPYRQIDRLHRQISLLVIGLVGVHVLATALDAMGDSWKTVLIPWQWANQGWPQAVWGYTTGIIALWVLVIVAPTYYVRRLIRLKRWRFLHRFVTAFYAFSVWHALILGADMDHYPWVRPVTWLLQIPVLVLFVRRLCQPMRRARHVSAGLQPMLRAARYTLAGASCLAVVAIAAMVLTGHSGFIARV
jgi:hypothetical protein